MRKPLLSGVLTEIIFAKGLYGPDPTIRLSGKIFTSREGGNAWLRIKYSLKEVNQGQLAMEPSSP